MAAAEAAAARFGLEARVECNCGTWEPGAVVGHDYTDERLDGQVCPYQVRLDDGRLFCVPLDDVSAPAPCPQSTSCLLTSPVCARCRTAPSAFPRRLKMATMKMPTGMLWILPCQHYTPFPGS